MQGGADWMTGMKLRKTDGYNGKRDDLTVNTCVYKIQQYKPNIFAKNPRLTKTMKDERMLVASTFLTITAVVW